MKIRPDALLIFDVLDLPLIAHWWCNCGNTWNQADMSEDKEKITLLCSKGHFETRNIRKLPGVTSEIISQIDFGRRNINGVRYSRIGSTIDRRDRSNFKIRFYEWKKNKKDTNLKDWKDNAPVSAL